MKKVGPGNEEHSEGSNRVLDLRLRVAGSSLTGGAALCP